MIYTPADINAARRVTEKLKPMAGVMSASFLCQKCGQRRKVEGRKQVIKGSPKFGYICRECVK